ncbi:MAG: class I SAM-dependent methyltransferase [Hahellaceae bacterium]|jgi:SAM-dependent methyltransferase|nr:class I SAM-dependent methyltransferase [Hahellaceae bacterium]
MSVNFYNNNAKTFFDSTKDVDMSHLWKRFLAYLPQNAHILDAGCGSGRDSKHFIQQGITVTAFDASAALVEMAEELIGQPVHLDTFQTFQSATKFDGIWACASLLHVPAADLPSVFTRLANMLKPGSVFYCSFKYGNEDIEKVGRNFTNCDEFRLKKLIENTGLATKDLWVSEDARPGRQNEKWLNGILVKG